MCLSGAPTSKLIFVPGLPKGSPETTKVWIFATLWDYNSLLRPPIGMRFEANGGSHYTYTHKGRVDSRLFVIGSQFASLTPDLSFCHNLCCRCPNGSCEHILNIYTLIHFQWYKELPDVRCLDPYNFSVKFWESEWTLKFPFQECESSSSRSLKIGVATHCIIGMCQDLVPQAKQALLNCLLWFGVNFHSQN
jgi:hypothetical protein